MRPATNGPRPAQLSLRFCALMIDGLVVGAVRLALRAVLAPWPVVFAAAAAYYTAMPMAYDGQTFGKMAAGIAIRDDHGQRLHWAQCLGRYLGYFLSTALLGAGFLLAFFHPERRALHDIIAVTRVDAVEAISDGRRAAVIVVGLASALAVPFLFLTGLLLSRL